MLMIELLAFKIRCPYENGVINELPTTNLLCTVNNTSKQFRKGNFDSGFGFDFGFVINIVFGEMHNSKLYKFNVVKYEKTEFRKFGLIWVNSR